LAFVFVIILVCPCAIGIAIPCCFDYRVWKGAENGILFKVWEYLEIARSNKCSI
jgi:cation transport ATPase